MKQLKKFILWLIGLGLICIIGISNVFGATTKIIYSDIVANGTLSGSNQYKYGYMNQGGVIVPTTASVGSTIQGVSYAFTFAFYENTLLSNTYTLKIYFNSDDLKSNFSSDMIDIKTCGISSCNSAVLISVSPNNPSGYSSNLTIKFNPVVIGSIIQVNISGGNNAITGVSNFGISSVTIDSLNQNEDIMNNANQNANNIISNQNTNTQDIIDSSASNTQTIIDSQYSCNSTTIDLSEEDSIKNKNLNSSGNIISNNSTILTNYIRIVNNEDYTITFNYAMGNPSYCLYDKDKVKISCSNYNQQQTITFSSGSAEYIRLSYRNDTSDRKSELTGYICQKTEEETKKTNKGILKKLTELITKLFDTSGPDTSDLENMVGWLPPGPVDSILNLPLILYNSYLNALTGTCEPLHIEIPFLNNEYIDIPCISIIFNGINGLPAFWTWVGVITSVVILYRYLISLYQYYDKLTTLQANFYDDFGGAP